PGTSLQVLHNMQSSLTLDAQVSNEVGAQKRRWLKWPIIVGFWTFFGLLNGTQLYLGLRMEGLRLSLWRVFASDVFGWWPWIAATPIVLALGRRFPFERGSWW